MSKTTSNMALVVFTKKHKQTMRSNRWSAMLDNAAVSLFFQKQTSSFLYFICNTGFSTNDHLHPFHGSIWTVRFFCLSFFRWFQTFAIHFFLVYHNVFSPLPAYSTNYSHKHDHFKKEPVTTNERTLSSRFCRHNLWYYDLHNTSLLLF